MDFERAFVQPGGLLIAGPDPPGNGGIVAGFGDLRQVALLVEAGFTPTAAIAIASLNGAKFLGEDARIGSIGGKKGHTGGFAANRELARIAGARGGRVSRRTKKSV